MTLPAALRRIAAMTSTTAILIASSGGVAWAAPGPVGTATGIPNPKPQAPPGVSNKVDQILGFLKYFGIAAVVAGLILAGISMALGASHGRGGREGVEKLGYIAGGAIIIGTASAIAGFLLS